MKRAAVINKTTNEVENIIVLEYIPNHEEEEHYYVSLDREVKNVVRGWKYNKQKMEFFTDNPDLEEASYSAEEMLKMEELAWEKMLSAVKMGHTLNKIATKNQKKQPKKLGVKKPKKKK